LVIYVQ